MSDAKLPILPFFVYGTLLRGQPNHFMWAGAALKVEKAVLPGAALYDCGAFPMLALRRAGTVKGELVWVRENRYAALLARLDALEGIDPAEPGRSIYQRQPQWVLNTTQQGQHAWVYIGNENVARHLPEVPGGDWAAHLAAWRSRLAGSRKSDEHLGGHASGS